MVRTISAASIAGLDVRRVLVEVSIRRGTPMIHIVGLAHSAVREGCERIRAAATQLGLHVPGLRITVNLAPADIPKQGSAFDLPITLGILAAAAELPMDRLEGAVVMGELGLDGAIRPVRGALPIALHAARDPAVRRLILPLANVREASAAPIEVRGAASLGQLIAHLRHGHALPDPERGPSPDPMPPPVVPDLSSVRGQGIGKRALEIAAAGGHNLLLSGVPGSGKTSLARCLPGLLPDLTLDEAVEVTAIHSVAGLLPDDSGLLRTRPFRSPHHTISRAGLIGGGSIPRPGEVSLAHRGVLFLDELPQFGQAGLDALREPIEEGEVRIVRTRAAASFPARFILVAAMNPCPCGHLGDERRCTCADGVVDRYRRRLSGPLLDRIDLHVDVPAVTWPELQGGGGERSRVVRSRVAEARARANRRTERPGAGGGRATGAGAIPSGAELESADGLDRGARSILRRAVDRFGLSARGYVRALRVARTIADLSARDRVSEECVAEAIRYRVSGPKDAG